MITHIPLLLEAVTVSLVVTFVASSSSIVATVISDDKNETNFGSFGKLFHLETRTSRYTVMIHSGTMHSGVYKQWNSGS